MNSCNDADSLVNRHTNNKNKHTPQEQTEYSPSITVNSWGHNGTCLDLSVNII